MSLIRISESDNFIVDYDKKRRMYRVSIFENHHFQDEYWFEEYKEKMTDEELKQIASVRIKHREEIEYDANENGDVYECGVFDVWSTSDGYEYTDYEVALEHEIEWLRQ